jgi:hypothetical protein
LKRLRRARTRLKPEMVTRERKIHQKKGNKIPYLLFVSRLHELTKAIQFIDPYSFDNQ